MSKYTKYLQFNLKTKQVIYQREHGECFFCQQNYYMRCISGMLYDIKDIMHYIPKSQGGLGVEQHDEGVS